MKVCSKDAVRDHTEARTIENKQRMSSWTDDDDDEFESQQM